MKRFLSLVAIAIASRFLFPLSASAVCRVPEIKPRGEFFKSDAVFVGTVTSSKYTSRDVGGWFYRLYVDRVFRGPDEAEVTIYTEDSDIRFPLERKRTYLLFAYRRHGRLEIDSCGNSALLAVAAESVRSIEGLAEGGQGGEIEGWVVAETGGIDTSGVRVVVRGASKTYTAISDKEGWFHFRAPAGRYRVDFTSGDYYLNGDDYFWYDPNHFSLHAGEIASLQLVSVRHLKN